MQSFLSSPFAAFLSGFICFFLTIGVLWDLGLRRHGNYEYYGVYWWVYCGAGGIGMVSSRCLPFPRVGDVPCLAAVDVPAAS